MVKGLVSALGGLDEHAQVGADALLAAVLVKRLRPERAVLVQVLGGKLAGDVAAGGGAPWLACTRNGAGAGVSKEVLLACLPHHLPPPRRRKA